MSSPAEQLQILKDIFIEEFEAKKVGIRQNATLYEVTLINGVDIPDGITILIDFEDSAKIRMVTVPYCGGGTTEEQDHERFMGNLNVFVMRGKKTLNLIHKPHSGEEFKTRFNTFSFQKILESTKL